MGFHVEINSILRSDVHYELRRGSEFEFHKEGSRVFFDSIPILLTKSDWTALAEIRILSQSRSESSVSGVFRVLHVYESMERDTLTESLRRMFAAGDDPFIYLLMSPAEHAQASATKAWEPDRFAKDGFIHASPATQLTRVANKYYSEYAEVLIAILRHERVAPEVKWEPGTDGLYPHIYGPLNTDAVERVVKVEKGPDGRFVIGAEQLKERKTEENNNLKLEIAPDGSQYLHEKGRTGMNLSKEVPFLHNPVVRPGRQGAAIEPEGKISTLARASRTNDLFLRGGISIADRDAAIKSTNAFEARVGRSNLLPAIFLENGVAHSRATCLIHTSGVDYMGRRGSWSGTGFLVSPNILLTNNHVINTEAVATAATAIFNYQAGIDGESLATTTFRLRPDLLYLSSSAVNGLDYTFCWVDGTPGQLFGKSAIDRQAWGIAEGEFANIISHPDGRMKEVAIQENTVKWQDDLVVHYTSDTEPGSSGAAVCNNNWQLIALHHASKETGNPNEPLLNEGIKLSAIAVDLERIIALGGATGSVAQKLLALFAGTDERLGFFGTLGREASSLTGLEAVVDSFSGTERDLDIGFWNVEWLTKHYDKKAAAVAQVIHKLNLDVWALEESSENAAKAVAEELKATFDVEYGVLAAEPGVEGGKQSCTILWNKEFATVEKVGWGQPIETWLKARSADFDELNLGGFEAVHGKIFDRYPELFKVTSQQADENGNKLDFFLVALHLKAMGEGSMRRKMASKILAAAIERKIADGADADFIVGGDANAELGTGEFDNLTDGGLVPVSAVDESNGAFSYIKGPKSLIDHIFLSPNLSRSFDEDDFFIVAAERQFPDFVAKVSDHRPVLLRMSMGTDPGLEGDLEANGAEFKSAIEELHELVKSKTPNVVINDKGRVPSKQ